MGGWARTGTNTTAVVCCCCCCCCCRVVSGWFESESQSSVQSSAQSRPSHRLQQRNVCNVCHVCMYVCMYVCVSKCVCASSCLPAGALVVGWLVSWLVGWLVGWLVWCFVLVGFSLVCCVRVRAVRAVVGLQQQTDRFFFLSSVPACVRACVRASAHFVGACATPVQQLGAEFPVVEEKAWPRILASSLRGFVVSSSSPLLVLWRVAAWRGLTRQRSRVWRVAHSCVRARVLLCFSMTDWYDSGAGLYRQEELFKMCWYARRLSSLSFCCCVCYAVLLCSVLCACVRVRACACAFVHMCVRRRCGVD